MPTISMFYGIIIQMFWDDHAPPHFHALYAEYEVQIDIKTLEIIKGNMPRRALALVLEWAHNIAPNYLRIGHYATSIKLRKKFHP
ncbi:MAG: hypothetical protein ACD_45C00025G0001 [uncultured bacterium]|nr:MAG: hypothetical protein ACD_45C00025G0001 [uncultured bacterium]